MESYIKHCDCLDGMRELADNSIDLMCTDPPYGMSFMGKRWDKAVPSIDIWRECLRVLKPGAFAFVMSIPRQDCQAEMIRRLTEAGFVMSFTPIFWTFASGFPKASNISKMIDKRAGAKGEIYTRPEYVKRSNKKEQPASQVICGEKGVYRKPATPEAKHFDGWFGGFQPKPAVEIILVCMKPLTEKTYVDQALKNGRGCVNFDACRIPYEGEADKGDVNRFNTGKPMLDPEKGWNNNSMVSNTIVGSGGGRFPANLLVSDNVLDDGRTGPSNARNRKGQYGGGVFGGGVKKTETEYNDTGQFSRFFSLDAWNVKQLPASAQKTFPFMIVEKASKVEKNEGCKDLPEKQKWLKGGQGTGISDRENIKSRNVHPTAKPVKLMSYLITLASRQGDIILDPFLGSGSTCVAAKALFCKYIGFEREKEYYEIAKARIEHENFMF